jgi:hypothetical protein
MMLLARCVLAFVLACAGGMALSAQRIPEAWMRSLFMVPAKEVWIFSDWTPGSWRVCGGLDPDGTPRGCVSARDLRMKADEERKARKAEP